MQGSENKKINGALATVKHFLGDGSTFYGANMGSARVLDYKNYIRYNVKGYIGASEADVGSVMISYSSINFVPMAYQSHYLQGVLREEVNFRGFTVSDYDDLGTSEWLKLPRTFMKIERERSYDVMVNAGIDMFTLSKADQTISQAKHASSIGLVK